MGNFHLTKWYLDCVDERGNAFIGYSARLRWGLLRFNLASRLTRIDGSIESHAAATRSWQQPDSTSDPLAWHSTALGARGIWQADSRPVGGVLFDSTEGRVVWNCLQPRSQTCVTLGPNRVLSGLGYAECLEMTVAPWRLGIHTMRWGRFHSPNHHVIWIRWEGERPLSKAWHNGQEVKLAAVDDRLLELGNGATLSIDNGATLRHGATGDTVLAKLPCVKLLLPRWLAGIKEQKWLSRGKYRDADGASSEGWVIHEHVAFES